ncbi:hypothetical protein [Micromonospora sagamiensis]|uniref:Uncharacterized protein n=1 Tax=Micromonospora sagamiensis TaxID=47875 RepID=A0A562W9J8_9ACTN|nr:hypothetical protein [Micromonospora sagamiensis]TWJ26876.1 hypothetical protein JD81_00358 [Micromonospora sagamiensis]BCL14235.1 hypothetical protein GCM10017556_19740 [Micromonospora sagamiensis]
MVTHDVGADLVHIAVPVAYVRHVAALLAELDRQGGDVRPPARPPARPAPPELAGQWSVADLRRFATGRSKSHDTVLKVLDLLAVRPGEWFSAEAICVEVGVSRHRFGGALAGMTRMLRAHPTFRELGPPMNRYVTGSLDDRAGTFYWMTSEQAGQWKLARAGEAVRPGGS